MSTRPRPFVFEFFLAPALLILDVRRTRRENALYRHFFHNRRLFGSIVYYAVITLALMGYMCWLRVAFLYRESYEFHLLWFWLLAEVVFTGEAYYGSIRRVHRLRRSGRLAELKLTTHTPREIAEGLSFAIGRFLTLWAVTYALMQVSLPVRDSAFMRMDETPAACWYTYVIAATIITIVNVSAAAHMAAAFGFYRGVRGSMNLAITYITTALYMIGVGIFSLAFTFLIYGIGTVVVGTPIRDYYALIAACLGLLLLLMPLKCLLARHFLAKAGEALAQEGGGEG
ncbi:MAG: hypothetical protein RLY93_01060 [Sumerlaeia bacterium]